MAREANGIGVLHIFSLMNTKLAGRGGGVSGIGLKLGLRVGGRVRALFYRRVEKEGRITSGT